MYIYIYVCIHIYSLYRAHIPWRIASSLSDVPQKCSGAHPFPSLLRVHMCVYIRRYVYVCICVYIKALLGSPIVYIYVYMYMYVYACIYTYICIRIYTYICICMYMRVHKSALGLTHFLSPLGM